MRRSKRIYLVSNPVHLFFRADSHDHNSPVVEIRLNKMLQALSLPNTGESPNQAFATFVCDFHISPLKRYIPSDRRSARIYSANDPEWWPKWHQGIRYHRRKCRGEAGWKKRECRVGSSYPPERYLNKLIIEGVSVSCPGRRTRRGTGRRPSSRYHPCECPSSTLHPSRRPHQHPHAPESSCISRLCRSRSPAGR